MDIRDMLYDGETVYCTGECEYGRDLKNTMNGMFSKALGMLGGMLSCTYAVTNKRFILGIAGRPVSVQFCDVLDVNTAASGKDVALMIRSRGNRTLGEMQEMYLRNVTDAAKLVSSLKSMTET